MSQWAITQVARDPLSNLRILLRYQVDHCTIISLKRLLSVGDEAINQIETFGVLRSLNECSPVAVINNINSIYDKILESC